MFCPHIFFQLAAFSIGINVCKSKINMNLLYKIRWKNIICYICPFLLSNFYLQHTTWRWISPIFVILQTIDSYLFSLEFFFKDFTIIENKCSVTFSFRYSFLTHQVLWIFIMKCVRLESLKSHRLYEQCISTYNHTVGSCYLLFE